MKALILGLSLPMRKTPKSHTSGKSILSSAGCSEPTVPRGPVYAAAPGRGDLTHSSPQNGGAPSSIGTESQQVQLPGRCSPGPTPGLGSRVLPLHSP